MDTQLQFVVCPFAEMSLAILYATYRKGHDVSDLCGKILTAGGLPGWLLREAVEDSLMSDRTNDSCFQDGPTTGQGQAHQR